MALAHSKLSHYRARNPIGAMAVIALGLAGAALESSTAALAQTAPDSSGGASATLQAPNDAAQPISPGDVLNVSVADQPDITNNYTVDNNGNITMPYVGNVHVGGLTVTAANTAVQTALAKYYVNPVVTLTRPTAGGYTIVVTGAITRQGTQTVRRDAHLNDVVQLDGPTADADLTHVQLTRGLPGQTHQTLTVNLSTFLNGGDVTGNPSLQDGDQIYVPNRAAQRYSVSVVGEVKNPHRYDVDPNTTVFDLITLAGGLTDTADPSSIYIQPVGTLDREPVNYDQARATPGNPGVNPILKDNDKVVVPEKVNISTFSITGAVLKPGQYPLEAQLSLAAAEGLADGLADRAQVDKITITRETPSGAQVLKVNAKDPAVAGNFLLQPGDNVFIPQGHPPNKVDPFQLAGIAIAIIGLVIAR